MAEDYIDHVAALARQGLKQDGSPMKFPRELPISGLQIGDVVQAFEGAFGTAIVIKVTDERVTTFRPYATTSGFIYGSEPQTIPYTGHETMDYFREGRGSLKVLERRPHK